MVTFHISKKSYEKLDELYKSHVIDSKDNVVALAIAIGLFKNVKKELDEPRVFRQSFSDMDRYKFFTILAIDKNLELESEEEICEEVEKYAEGGLEIIFNEEIKDGKLDYYSIYHKYS